MPRPPPRPQTPPPLTFTLTVPSPQAQPIQEADLGLDSQWFYRQPLAFPDALLRIPYTSLAAGGEFSSGGGPSRLDVGILYGDRSRGFVTIEWGGGLSPLAPRVAQHQMAPPRPRTAGELAHAAEELGERVALWAEAREGTVVGRGECWDLADQALKEVSRALVDEGAAGGGLAEAVGIGFGEVVFVNVGGNVAWGPERRIRRGDVLQFVVSRPALPLANRALADHNLIFSAAPSLPPAARDIQELLQRRLELDVDGRQPDDGPHSRRRRGLVRAGRRPGPRPPGQRRRLFAHSAGRVQPRRPRQRRGARVQADVERLERGRSPAEAVSDRMASPCSHKGGGRASAG